MSRSGYQSIRVSGYQGIGGMVDWPGRECSVLSMNEK